MVSDFLFELGCEELPSASVWPLAQALAENITKALEKAQLNFVEVKPFATPRRLACIITQIAQEQPTQTLKKRGPALKAAYDEAGNPTKALQGFLQSCNTTLDALEVEKTDKGEWLAYSCSMKGAKTCDLLPEIVKQALNDLPIAKHMRWGDGDYSFVRPVHWAVMLFGEQIIATDILGVKSGNLSYGHRFHHPQAIVIAHPHVYEQLLKEAFVIADFHKRQATILQQIEVCAKTYKAKAVTSEALLDEVTSIVEWPDALVANFDAKFLHVPHEALIASIKAHQKCFALQDNNGQLLPHFIAISNIESKNPKQVILGNEKVMRARLSDAAFFFEVDKKSSLSARIPATEKVIFQQQLGTLADKAQRVEALMEILSQPLALNKALAKRAAALSKCDLLTGMVGEFPELQGIMGTYYAKHDGEEEALAIALQEQYLPRFSQDNLPETPLGLALSLADRIDTLVGIFSIGQKPSGVKDPFKLRRHALAVVRLLINNPAPILLSSLLKEAAKGVKKQVESPQEIVDELYDFIMDRLLSHYHAQGISNDKVLAVKARQGDWLYDFDRRIQALKAFVLRPEAVALSMACKRVHNLLNQAPIDFQAKDLDKTLFTEAEEKALFQQIEQMETLLKPLYEKGDYCSILNNLASLSEPIDAFFAKVMVMVDDAKLKHNRLILLAHLQKLLQGVADISLLTV